MKKLSLILLALVSVTAFAQKAKKPTIMVVPADDYCFSRGYISEFINPTTDDTLQFADYKKALQNETDLNSVITQIGKMFSDRGFNLKDLKATIDKMEEDELKQATIGIEDGYEAGVSIEDELMMEAKADILLKTTWKVAKQGPYKMVTFTIKAIDAYTNKQIGGATGTGEKSTTPEVSLLLKEAVLSHIDNLQSQMQNHFDDLLKNGREVSLRVIADANSAINLEDDDIYDFLLDWMDTNTVNGVYSETKASSAQIIFEQVRIPIYVERGETFVAVDAKRYFRSLSKEVKSTFSYSCKVKSYGLGEVWLLISDY